MPRYSNSLGPLPAYVASGIAPESWTAEKLQTAYAPAESWGQRGDGSTKGTGWFGAFPMANDNSMASEIGVGVELDGKQIGVPSINPFQSKEQIQRLLQGVDASFDPDIIQNTMDWGYYRSSQGLSPFIQQGEQTVDFENHDPTYWRLRSKGVGLKSRY